MSCPLKLTELLRLWFYLRVCIRLRVVTGCLWRCRVWAERTVMVAVYQGRGPSATDRTSSTTTTPGRCGLTTEIYVLEVEVAPISTTHTVVLATTATQVRSFVACYMIQGHLENLESQRIQRWSGKRQGTSSNSHMAVVGSTFIFLASFYIYIFTLCLHLCE